MLHLLAMDNVSGQKTLLEEEALHLVSNWVLWWLGADVLCNSCIS